MIVKSKAKEIISYYKRKFKIKDKDKIIEVLDWQVQYVSDFSKRREDYIDDNDIIYKFIRENFWNISNYSYDFKIVKEKKDNA